VFRTKQVIFLFAFLKLNMKIFLQVCLQELKFQT